MLKELINQFHAIMDHLQKDFSPLKSDLSFSKRTNYLPSLLHLKNGKEIRLEIGTRAHITDILEIERLGYNGKTPWGYVALENDMVRSRQSLYFLLYHKAEPIAFLGSRFEITDIHITNLAVAPEWQGQGVGSLLLELLKVVAHKEAVSNLTLEVRVSNQSAKYLYKKMGFESVRIKKNYYHGDGEDAVDMRLVLQEPQETREV